MQKAPLTNEVSGAFAFWPEGSLLPHGWDVKGRRTRSVRSGVCFGNEYSGMHASSASVIPPLGNTEVLLTFEVSRAFMCVDLAIHAAPNAETQSQAGFTLGTNPVMSCP